MAENRPLELTFGRNPLKADDNYLIFFVCTDLEIYNGEAFICLVPKTVTSN